jgi:hypothetical protein
LNLGLTCWGSTLKTLVALARALVTWVGGEWCFVYFFGFKWVYLILELFLFFLGFFNRMFLLSGLTYQQKQRWGQSLLAARQEVLWIYYLRADKNF